MFGVVLAANWWHSRLQAGRAPACACLDALLPVLAWSRSCLCLLGRAPACACLVALLPVLAWMRSCLCLLGCAPA
eukprot:1154215-Pelagomonas_calceolata.AAC.6